MSLSFVYICVRADISKLKPNRKLVLHEVQEQKFSIGGGGVVIPIFFFCLDSVNVKEQDIYQPILQMGNFLQPVVEIFNSVSLI